MRRATVAVALALLAVLVLGGAVTPAPRGGVAARTPAKRKAAKAPAAPRRPAAPDSAAFDSVAWDSVGEPQLYLSWRAPHGMPRASDTMTFVPGDTTRVDTLFMSFETGQDGPDFLGMMARLYFHPAYGDTLGPCWRYSRGDRNWRGVAIEFDPDGTFPCPQPWVRNGYGLPSYEFDRRGSKLELYYVLTRMEDAAPVSGRTRYCFARVMFRQRRADLPGVHLPVCIEWADAKFSLNGRDHVARLGPQRFVSVNSPDGSVSTPYRRGSRLKPWIPPPNRSPGTPGQVVPAPGR